MLSDFLTMFVLWGVYLIAATVIAAWVFRDSGHRGLAEGKPRARVGWVLLTFLLLPFALPAYLLIGRPPGDLARCPTCGATVFRHRATCWQCGSPLTGPLPVWGIGDIIGVVIVFLLFLIMVMDVTRFFGEAMSSVEPLSTLIVIQNGLLVGLAVYVVRIRYGQPLAALGLRWRPVGSMVAKGVLVSLLALPLSGIAEMAERAAIAVLIGRARVDVLAAAEQSKNHLFALLKAPLSVGEIVWLGVLVCVLVPVGEEIFFRGFLYGALRARLRLPFAVGLSALIFAGVHLPAIFTFLPIFVLGVVLAILYERTGTVLPGIVVHAINNAIAILAFLYGWNA